MKKIIVLGCSKNQIEYLKVLKQKFQIILLDKNINLLEENLLINFSIVLMMIQKKLIIYFKKILLNRNIFFLHHLTLHLLDFHIWQKLV